MNTIWQLLSNTPWWVYLLLAYLIKIGIDASKIRIVELKKIFIIPALFIFMSIHTLLYSFPVEILTVSTWSVAILIGICLGWIQVYRYQLRVDKNHALIEIPGTWSTLAVIIIIFIAKYYFAHALAVDPARAEQTSFEISALLISGVCTGYFLGRLICYLYRYRTLPSTALI